MTVLQDTLSRIATSSHYLFATDDLRALIPGLSYDAFRAMLSRAARRGIVERLCRGIYLYPGVARVRGYELYHAAARLRAHEFSYISLESALSDLGIISQIPVARITLMSTGRSTTVGCGHYGIIEFVHTAQDPNVVAPDVVYDEACRLWRATPSRALRDIRATGRSLDLVDWRIADDALNAL